MAKNRVLNLSEKERVRKRDVHCSLCLLSVGLADMPGGWEGKASDRERERERERAREQVGQDLIAVS